MAAKTENNELLDLANVPETFDLLDGKLKVIARALDMNDFIELQQMFPDQNVFNPTDFLNTKGLEAFAAIAWLGVRKDTPQLEELASIHTVINVRTIPEWQPVLSYISGIEFADTDNADEPPPKAEDEAVEPKNG